ncbi:MAG: hypothetical protein JNM89_07665 [Hyphomicrobiaceae bacterium]|nr:hypothetical protein [Hyphomicrobiaceae bacterium]
MTKTAPWLGGAVILGAVLLVGWGGTGEARLATATPAAGFGALHGPSLLAGVAMGVSACAMRRVPWLALPRRAIAWLASNQSNIALGAVATACMGVLLFY